jgi:hypothetical protein
LRKDKSNDVEKHLCQNSNYNLFKKGLKEKFSSEQEAGRESFIVYKSVESRVPLMYRRLEGTILLFTEYISCVHKAWRESPSLYRNLYGRVFLCTEG